MKRKNVIKGVVALAVVGLIGATFASADAAMNKRADFASRENFGRNMTAEQIAEKDALRSEHQSGMVVRQEAVQTALANSDYNAFKEAAGEKHPLADKITEENFPRFVEAHNLMQSGRQIMEELGIEHQGMGMFPGEHKGFGRNFQR